MRKIDTQNFQRATRSTHRNINRQIVLNLIREHQPISRAELARKLQVARGVVGPLVSELLADRLIYEGATGSLPRGRKPTLLHIRSHDRLVLGIDVQSSGTHVLLSDFGAHDLARETLQTSATPCEFVAEVAARIKHMLASHGAAGRCEGAGIVVPGMVNRETGRVMNAPTLGWRDVDLCGALEDGLGLPVHIERDALAGAMAWMWNDRPDETSMGNFVYVIVSDGVGAGLVVDGQLIRGSCYEAGEFGHIPLSLDGPFCLCGSRGCWEAYVSNPATIARYTNRDLANRESYAEVRELGLTVTELIQRARRDDAAALEALRATARYLGFGLAGIIKALNPNQIIVGGEIAAAWDLLGSDVREAVASRALSPTTAATPLRPDRADHDARLRGATALVMAPVFAAPRVA